MQISPELVERAARALHDAQLKDYHLPDSVVGRWQWNASDAASEPIRNTWRRAARRVLEALLPLIREAALSDGAVERGAAALFLCEADEFGESGITEKEFHEAGEALKVPYRERARACLRAVMGGDERADHAEQVEKEGDTP